MKLFLKCIQLRLLLFLYLYVESVYLWFCCTPLYSSPTKKIISLFQQHIKIYILFCLSLFPECIQLHLVFLRLCGGNVLAVVLRSLTPRLIYNTYCPVPRSCTFWHTQLACSFLLSALSINSTCFSPICLPGYLVWKMMEKK